jgi:hypothetical protein
VTCGTLGLNTATVKMKGPDGILRISTGTGTGGCAVCHLCESKATETCQL